jgi:hypothetical protein
MRLVLILIAIGLLLVESGSTVKSARMTNVVAATPVAKTLADKARVDF